MDNPFFPLNRLKTRFRLYLTFQTSTLPLSIISGLAFASLSIISATSSSLPEMNSTKELILAFWGSWLRLIPSFGLMCALFYKEMNAKEEYFFYYNRKIGKYELWIVTFLIDAFFCSIFYLITRICVHAWK